MYDYTLNTWYSITMIHHHLYFSIFLSLSLIISDCYPSFSPLTMSLLRLISHAMFLLYVWVCHFLKKYMPTSLLSISIYPSLSVTSASLYHPHISHKHPLSPHFSGLMVAHSPLSDGGICNTQMTQRALSGLLQEGIQGVPTHTSWGLRGHFFREYVLAVFSAISATDQFF